MGHVEQCGTLVVKIGEGPLFELPSARFVAGDGARGISLSGLDDWLSELDRS
jgi:hypothetical protein